MYVMNCLYVKMLGLLFLVVFCCGKVQSQVKVMSMPAANGQTLSASVSYTHLPAYDENGDPVYYQKRCGYPVSYTHLITPFEAFEP